MAGASYAVSNFLGGEISEFAQGRFDKPEYRSSLKVCYNSFPVEIGPWVRRPGTMFAGETRAGVAGRVVKFDFEQANAITLEFTNGWLRFRAGPRLLTTNDANTVTGISTADPAVLELGSAANWETGDTVIFANPGPASVLENRRFTVTKLDTTHFSLADEIGAATVDGSTLGTITTGGAVTRVQELATPYLGDQWQTMREVQAETTDLLLSPATPPQALTVSTMPSEGVDAQFEINPATFNDGPYLDPPKNGATMVPGSKSGIVSFTLTFPDWNSATAYAKGAFVLSSGTNYISLADQNVNNSPASSPSWWAATSAGAAINDGRGFLGSDIGRLIRLFSEPALWDDGSSYVAGATVSYNPSGKPGAATYWQALTSTSAGEAPGTNLTKWELMPSGAAIWTWGRIVDLSNIIDRQLSGSTVFGNMTSAGGLAGAFNGSFSQGVVSSAQYIVTGGAIGFQPSILVSSYVGKDFHSSPQTIQQAVVYGTTDYGYAFGQFQPFGGGSLPLGLFITLNLRASQTLPVSPSSGTLLGTSGSVFNKVGSYTIPSNDQTTAWRYVWIEQVTTAVPTAYVASFTVFNCIAQVSFFNPPGSGSGNGALVEIIGAPLLYTNPVVTWRLGAYSNTTGYPTCGCYDDGRIWLSGAIPNRFDACVANGIDGGSLDFAPTDQFGTVAGSSAISYTLNSDSVNPIYWMEPDLQGIILGTQAGEYLVQAPASGAITPTNIVARRVTKIGCANVEPRRTDHTSVFVQRYGQKLMEYFSDVYSGKFSAPNIADRAQHITREKIAEIGYQNGRAPIIWGRNDAGALFGTTYKRNTLATAEGPTFAAWHRHGLGSGRIVESLCVGPSVGGDLDSLTMVTSDPATGIRHVEILTDAMDELSPLTDAWFLDDAVSPSSTAVTHQPSTGAPYGGMTANGLAHLNGKTVTVFAGGLDCGDFPVTDGSCFVPFGDGISAGTGGGLFTEDYVVSFSGAMPIVVGFTYASRGQLVRPILPQDTGARNGPGFGKVARSHRYAMQVVRSRGISIGTDFSRMDAADFKQANGQSIAPLQTFSGIHQDSLSDDYSLEYSLCWEVTRPYPANIVAIGPNLSTQDQ